MKQRDPIDLHEYAPGQWSQRPYYETDDGRVDFSKMTDEDLLLHQQVLRRQRRHAPIAQMPADLGFVVIAIMAICILSGILHLFGIIG